MSKHAEYRQKLSSIMKDFEKKTFEREELIRLVVLAIFCKQHIFLFGKPGVGKTYLARLATMMFGPNKYWEILMAHDTTTEQLMGSLKKDEYGNVHRDLSDTMLDKPFVFLDEMFKGSNKVLNALLGPMLDRKYMEGGNVIEVPLVTLFGASNEFPEGEDIKPFEDRLMFRYDVQRLQGKENRVKYNNGEFDTTDKFRTMLKLEEIDYVAEQSKKIVFPDFMLDNYILLQDAILKDGISISDRKFGPSQAVKVFRTSAFLNGRTEIDFSDLMLLKHIAWHSLVDQIKLGEVLSNTLFGNPVSIEKTIMSLEDVQVRNDGLLDAHCGKALAYTKEYVGQGSGEEFQDDLRKMSAYLTQFNGLNAQIEKIGAKRAMAFDIIKQCSNNIFLFETGQNVYTTDLIGRIDKLSSFTQEKIGVLNEWLGRNERLYDYNNNKVRL